MKNSISFLFFIICTLVLAAQQSQARKGCNAYGHACYGGHGKRSLGSLVGGDIVGGDGGDREQDQLPSDAIIQVLPNEESFSLDGNGDFYPRYRLIRIMKSWFDDHRRRPTETRFKEFEYPLSMEEIIRNNGNTLN